MSGTRSRTTRLSSGSTSKRNYAEGLTSSDEDEQNAVGRFRIVKRISAGKGKARSSPVDLDSNSEDAFRPPSKKKKADRKLNRKSNHASGDSGSSSEFNDEDASEEDEEGVDSGALDSEEDQGKAKRAKGGKKAGGKRELGTSNGTGSTTPFYGDSEVIQIVRAPTEIAPSDRISEHTLAFMRDLQDPRKNDREWFAAHKNVYDYVHQNWLDFTGTCLNEMIDKVDDTIAWMPAKDLVERIYRDVRFSNDKTPYKRYLSWCASRGGRKGNYGKYYMALSANGGSGLHVGLYEPSKEDLQAMRDQIVSKSVHGQALRALVQDPIFVKHFGPPPKPAKSVQRSSLWGNEDELKRAPKGYDPEHPDAHWLRLKTYSVSHKFTDKEVTSPDFLQRLLEVARAAQPLVALINEILHGSAPIAPASQG